MIFNWFLKWSIFFVYFSFIRFEQTRRRNRKERHRPMEFPKQYTKQISNSLMIWEWAIRTPSITIVVVATHDAQGVTMEHAWRTRKHAVTVNVRKKRAKVMCFSFYTGTGMLIEKLCLRKLSPHACFSKWSDSITELFLLGGITCLWNSGCMRSFVILEKNFVTPKNFRKKFGEK